MSQGIVAAHTTQSDRTGPNSVYRKVSFAQSSDQQLTELPQRSSIPVWSVTNQQIEIDNQSFMMPQSVPSKCRSIRN